MVKAIINQGHLHHNLQVIRSHISGHASIMVVLKANAYGHGDDLLFSYYLKKERIDHFAVARLSEAIKLRQISESPTILILSPINPETYKEALENNITLTLTSTSDLISLNKVAKDLSKIAHFHLKIDTGMHRTGISPEDLPKFLEMLPSQKNLALGGVFTHFADADMIDSNFTDTQFALFEKEAKKIKSTYPNILLHAANSAAILIHPNTHLDLVRPGFILHGLNPFHEDNLDFNLKPTLSLSSEITRLHVLKKGESIGYNCTFTAEKDMLIATIAGGYADGIRRGPNPWTQVLISKQVAPIIGRVSMDQISVDLSQITTPPKLYQEVELISPDTHSPNSIQNLAQSLGTTGYEIATSISSRVKRELT